MSQIKAIFLYILALIVLPSPAIILGWIGFSLLDGQGWGWAGGLIGVILGLIIFNFSVRKVARQDAELEEESVNSEHS